MHSSISWPDLFRHVDQNGHLDRLEKLHSEIAELTSKLNDKRIELIELQSDIRRRMDGALQVATMLEVEVPDDARHTLANLRPPNINLPSGGYVWRPAGRVAFRSGISRAMWRLSAGSCGSAGRTGVLTSAEFRRLIGKKAWASLVSGDELTLTLPNGLTLSVAKASQLRRAEHAG